MSLISNYEYIRDWCNHKFLTKDDQVQVDLSNYYTKSEVDSTIDSAIESVDITSQLANVATSGNFYDLINKPHRIFYGTCNDASTTAVKNVSVSNGPAALMDSDLFLVYFSNASYSYTDQNSLKINSFAGYPIATAYWTAGKYVLFYYNGAWFEQLSILNDAGTLTTTSTSALSTATNESLSGSINLHKVSKTGSYSDLLNKPRIFVGTCGTSASATAKVVTCASYDTLTKGDVIFVTFGATNTATAPTLNVNSTGAKNIRCIVNGTLTTLPNAGAIYANETLQFQYDGTYWVLMNVDTNTAPGTLTTTSTSALSTATNEALSGSINLHKVSKTGSYDDLLNKPDLSGYVTTTEYQSDEEVIAASLNDLNNKINTNATTIGNILDEINTPSPRFMNPGDSLDFGNNETETNPVFIRGEYLKTTATVALPSAYASDISIQVTSYDGSTVNNPVSIANMLEGVYISLYSNDGCESYMFGGDELTITSGTATTTIPIEGSNGTPQVI